MTKKNFVFIGEAGSGKSEIAINVAISFAAISSRPVHFFDLDQTKPLFRSRDVKEKLEEAGVVFHYEEQFWDAPTLVGGVTATLADEDSIVIMDIGGNHQGARLIGGFEPFLNRENTGNYFVVNPYRPWSKDTISIDGTLSEILKVSHIKNIGVISNPNLGLNTTALEAIQGNAKVEEMIGEYIKIDYMCAMEELASEIKPQVDIPLIPIKLYLTSPWAEKDPT